MSKPKVFEKPTGVKDYLPEAAAKLRAIETKVLQCMEGWGYREIITPTLEFYDTVGVASSTEDRKLFKLLDRNGTTLVMRSDVTAPIARVVSSLLKEQPFPIRLSYRANVFRAFEAEAGRDAEFFQTGLELVGDASSESDAEVIALAIASLQAAGVEKFKIALGHVGFLTGLFNETLQERAEAQQALKECLLNRDHVGYRDTIKSLGLSEEVERELSGILRLRGGQEICAQAREVARDPLAQQSIAHLCEVWDVLEAYGVSEHVLIDLTMIGDFSYYTGMTFEGYAADLGFPVCSGGRYDNLLTQFGRPAPATGFALKTNRILEAVSHQRVERPGAVLIVYTAARRGEAFKKAQALRLQGDFMVETRLLAGEAQRVEAARTAQGAFTVNGAAYNDVIEFV
ncbi:ATP phosphoribosyltransferase regulatory subunit [Paenibacillus doosanensis]|uniref:ATP phosphoribosyltransferase regulatory subunit n=1 Tax=Paenibacillus konkukensis TaxID=2020716 RepID=A0ABY4RR86_9BACL|nr:MULTISPECIES: ATP phosphoribosyltransferase regulatory subunit [Paenibacillus]MCS7459245.1 ATP phosphoribosyltransferase regulatory subunit [Paenibacillus doosanensis]UQZ84296.1 ATP phosphoribosyltransferase regulatory subunit [Paenibacillus konkukensis]